MKKFFIVAVLLLSALMSHSAETSKTFGPDEISAAWLLSQYEEDEGAIEWENPEENGLPVSSNTAGYYPWIISNNSFRNVSKVEVEVYSEYSRLSISEVRVGNTYLEPDSEQGYISDPHKVFTFVTHSDIEPIGKIYIGFSDISRNILYIKSITITYEPGGADRQLTWSVSSLDINLGESFENPVLSGETEGVIFKTSNSSVAQVDNQGIITPISVGQTTITASCPEIYPWNASECSYTLNVNFNLTGTGTAESVTLTAPGTLQDIVSNLESPRIRSLKVSGPINSDDLSYLRVTTGRFSNLQEIDLSDAVLSPDNGRYAILRGKNHGIGMGYDQYVFILSDETRIEESSEATGLGGGVHTFTYYGNQLAGLFSGLTNLKRAVLPSSLTEVAPFLVSGCSSLVEISLPENYSTIGESAFENCSVLPQISVSSMCRDINDGAFANSGLVVFDFTNITNIGKEAFKNTKIGENLHLPAIEMIGDYAFYNSKSIKTVSFGNNLKTIGDEAFGGTSLEGKLILPEGLERIGLASFMGTNISEIEVPSSCLSVGRYAFSGTTWLKNAKLSANVDEVIYLSHIALEINTERTAHPSTSWTTTLQIREGTTSIADYFGYSFKYDYGKDKITSISLPTSLKWIGQEAFSEVLQNTEYIQFPDGLEYIGEDAFEGSGIMSLTLGSNIRNVGSHAFSHCDGLVLLKYNVPNADGSYIFQSCKGLEKVSFGSAVRNIPPGTFWGCSLLSRYEFDNLIIPTNTRLQINSEESASGFTIGENAFQDCSNLSSAVLPEDLISIGERAYEGANLKTLYCFAHTPIDIQSSGIFSNGKTTTIYVPRESEQLYKADPIWNKCNIVGAEMNSSVEDNLIDSIDPNSIVEIFNLNGVKVYEGPISDINVCHGIYIMKAGSIISKIQL